mgnify:CR=1 FL=1
MRLIHHPVLLNYYVTFRCNAKCSFCDIWEKPSPYVTLDAARRNLADARRLGVRVVDFTGGEPLLHRGLADLLRAARAEGLITTVTTNGMLYPKRAEELRGLVDMLHFSLDSADRATHDRGRGVACYDLVMESIRVAKVLGERPDILFTVFPDNLHELETVWRAITQPNGLVLIINPAFHYNEVAAGESLSREQLDYLTKFGRRPGVYLNEGFIELRRDGGNHTAKPVCRAASTTLVISPDDELVLPCYHLGEKKFPIAGELFQLYQQPEIKRLIALEGRLPACEGCTINCYMQPSFAVETSRYFWKALPSTIKYNRLKGTWKRAVFG